MQPDDFERLKTILEDAPRDYGFLAEYVGELEHGRDEEDIFLRLAFEYRGADRLIVSVVSELYEPHDAERKLEIRQWWHEKVRSETNQFDELRTRLSGLT